MQSGRSSRPAGQAVEDDCGPVSNIPLQALLQVVTDWELFLGCSRRIFSEAIVPLPNRLTWSVICNQSILLASNFWNLKLKGIQKAIPSSLDKTVVSKIATRWSPIELLDLCGLNVQNKRKELRAHFTQPNAFISSTLELAARLDRIDQ